jgi:quinol monooxygenase YgiN
MLHHVVLFRLTETIDDARQAELMAAFAALSTRIPDIIQLHVRRDILPPDSRRPVSSHYGLIGQFADLAALKRYQQHPDHVAALDQLRPYIEQMLVLDYEL